MFDLSFMFESMAKIISALWEAFVVPNKPLWIFLIIAFALFFILPKMFRFKFGR